MRVLVNDIPNKPHAHAGQVLDLPEQEAKDMLSRGTAVSAPDEPAPVTEDEMIVPPKAPRAPKPRR